MGQPRPGEPRAAHPRRRALKHAVGRVHQTGAVAVSAVLAGPTDIPALVDVLQSAFWDDPVMMYLFPDERSRSRRSARLFRALLGRHYLPMQTVWTTSDQAGAALWAPPGHWKLSTRQIARSLPGLLLGLGTNTVRSLRFMEEIDREHPTEPHWYLGVLGTDPPQQGKGIGSALLAPVLSRCDLEGVPAYLESSKESNVAFYTRHGFELTGELRPKGAPTMYRMWRDPRPA
jgi:GNAT superfamily N-acetyltransferase